MTPEDQENLELTARHAIESGGKTSLIREDPFLGDIRRTVHVFPWPPDTDVDDTNPLAIGHMLNITESTGEDGILGEFIWTDYIDEVDGVPTRRWRVPEWYEDDESEDSHAWLHTESSGFEWDLKDFKPNSEEN